MLSSIRTRRCSVILAAFVCLSIFGLHHDDVTAGPDEPTAPAIDGRHREAVRDSLRLQILHYSEMIRSLRDSLADHDRAMLDDHWIVDVEKAIGSLGETISSIADQLSALQIEIDAGQFSLSDGQGGRISLGFPQDLGERINKGIASITRVILDEIPDTLRVDADQTSFHRHWDGRIPGLSPAVSRPENRIRGDIIKFNDDLIIAADDVVEGNVVTILGNVVIKGKIQGDLVVILGNVELQQGAVIDGTFVQILGRLDRDDSVLAGSSTVRVADLGEGLLLLFGHDRKTATWQSFLAWQAMFMLVLCMVLGLLALLPRRRLEGVVSMMNERTAGSLGLGLLAVGFGHATVIGLSALLVVTVIGIPIALLVLLALALLDLAAIGVACRGIGRRSCAALSMDCSRPWQAVLLGMLLLHAPAFLAGLCAVAGLPPVLVSLLAWIGRVCKITALAVGLGAIVLARFGFHDRYKDSSYASAAVGNPSYHG